MERERHGGDPRDWGDVVERRRRQVPAVPGGADGHMVCDQTRPVVAVEGPGKVYYCPPKSNCQVSLLQEAGTYSRMDEVQWSHDELSHGRRAGWCTSRTSQRVIR
jgi:hypothetical protein